MHQPAFRDKATRIEQFQRACRARGLAVTIQRRVIFEALLDRDDHPSADQVYEDVRERIPGVSRTTVYRVLEALVELGVLSKLAHPGSAVRFDPTVRQHHHLVCRRCSRVADVEDERLDQVSLPRCNTQGYRIDEFHIHFRGLCPACLKQEFESSDKKRTRPAGGGTPGRNQPKGKMLSPSRRKSR